MDSCRQGIQVRAWVCIALVLFRWGIARSAQSCRLLALGVTSHVSTCDTEINQMSTLIACTNNDICWLNITMDNRLRLLCQIVKDIEYLRCINQDITLFQWLIEMIQVFFQVLALHVFLHHEVACTFLEVISDIGHEGMINMGQRRYFPLEIAHILLQPSRVNVI